MNGPNSKGLLKGTVGALALILGLSTTVGNGAGAAVSKQNTHADSSTSAPGAPAAPHLHECFAQLSHLRSDKAIACVTPLLVHVCRKGFKNQENRKTAAQYLLLIGRSLVFDDNLAAAQQCYFLAHQVDPSNTFAIYSLADAWERSGRAKDAAPFLARTFKDAASDPIAARYAIRYCSRSGMHRKGREIGEAALKLKGADKDWILHQSTARCYAREGYTVKGIAEYETAARLCPDPYTARLMETAIATLKRLGPESEQCFRAAALIQPDDPQWRAGLGAQLLGQKKDEAWQYLEGVAHCRRASGRSIFTYGSALVQKKQFSAAGKCADELQLLAPYSEQVFLLRVGLEANKDNVPQIYREFIALQPHTSLVYGMLSDYLLKHNQAAEAVSVRQAESKEMPESPTAWRGLGDAYSALGQWDNAKQAWDKSIALLSPADFAQLNELGRNEFANLYSGVGTCAYLNKNEAGALRYAKLFNENKFLPVLPWYLNVMEVRPPRLDMKGLFGKEREAAEHTMLADMLQQRKRINECIAEYRKAIELNPKDVNLHTYLMEAYSEAGDWFGVAREDWETSNRIISKIPEQFTKMGAAKKADNDKKETQKPVQITAPSKN